MVEACRGNGLDVVEGDALEHLAALPDGSLGGLFAAQVVGGAHGPRPIGQDPQDDPRFRIVSRRLLVVIALLAVLVPLSAQRATPPRARTPSRPAAPAKTERRVPFRVGEQLSYAITWSSFITATAATATVAVREKRPAYGSLAYYVVAEGRPTPIVAMLYSLYYKADSWLDAYTGLPLRASVFSQERARRQSEVTLFDRAHGTARHEVQEGSSSSARNLAVPARTHDPLSAIFALRGSPMAAGTRVLMPMAFNGNLYQVQVTIERRESLRTPLGTLPAWRLAPVLLDDGKPTDSPRGMVLWISDDGRRLPLKMQVELPTGRFDLTISSAR